MAAIVAVVVYLVVRRRRGGGAGEEPASRRRERRLSAGDGDAIPARRALALGLVQGPAELLPVSSSAHIVLIPWLAGWDWEEIDPELRKSFEVALHTGAAAALLIGQRRTDRRGAARVRRRRGAASWPSPSCPAAVVGYTLERPIERRLGGPRATAYGLLAGAAAMLVADTRPQLRGRGEAGAADGLALGVAQAAALAPGRLPQRRHPGRGPLAPLLARPGEPALAHDRAADHRRRHRAQGRAAGAAAAPTPELRRSLALGIGASFASTLASQRLIGLVERDRALWPYAAYRAALAAAGPAAAELPIDTVTSGGSSPWRSARARGDLDERDAYAKSRGRPGRRRLRGRRAGPGAGGDRARPALAPGAAARATTRA